MTIIGPGESPRERLTTNVSVVGGTTMGIETGEVERVVFLQISSRSLGEADEVETHAFGMTLDQAQWTAAQLARHVLDVGGPVGT